MNTELHSASAGSGELCLPPALRAKVRYRAEEASTYLDAIHNIPVAKKTLDKLRVTGGGPKFRKVNRTCLYERTELDRWALEKLGEPKGSTSE